jgi:hypothetical protein
MVSVCVGQTACHEINLRSLVDFLAIFSRHILFFKKKKKSFGSCLRTEHIHAHPELYYMKKLYIHNPSRDAITYTRLQ